MKAVINSVKHFVQKTLTTIQEATIDATIIAEVIDAQPTTARHVVVGSIIKAVFLEYWLLGESAQPCTATWTVEKLVNDATPMTQTQGQALHIYPNKKNIFKTGQGIIGDSNSNPIPVIREWIKIPKGKQRFGLGDALMLNVSVTGQADNGGQICGISIYKEYQ